MPNRHALIARSSNGERIPEEKPAPSGNSHAQTSSTRVHASEPTALLARTLDLAKDLRGASKSTARGSPGQAADSPDWFPGGSPGHTIAGQSTNCPARSRPGYPSDFRAPPAIEIKPSIESCNLPGSHQLPIRLGGVLKTLLSETRVERFTPADDPLKHGILGRHKFDQKVFARDFCRKSQQIFQWNPLGHHNVVHQGEHENHVERTVCAI